MNNFGCMSRIRTRKHIHTMRSIRGSIGPWGFAWPRYQGTEHLMEEEKRLRIRQKVRQQRRVARRLPCGR